MADNPPAARIVAEVRKARDEGLAPGFPQKVAANALGIAQRELGRAPPVTPERAAELCAAIRDGETGEALVSELIAIAIAKLEIDQPAYPGFKAWREGR